MKTICYHCGKEIKGTPKLAHLVDEFGATVQVGAGCWKNIQKAGALGHETEKQYPRLFVSLEARTEWMKTNGKSDD